MSDELNKENIIWNKENDIGYLILNTPPANKMDVSFFSRLRHIVHSIIPEQNLKALVIHGSNRHFSAGAELPELLDKFLGEAEYDNFGEIIKYPKSLFEYAGFFKTISEYDFPVIAAIRGICIGSAFELALSCHLRICAESATMGLPEATFGLMPGCGGTRLLPQIVGKAKALEIILSGNNISPEEAFEMGLVDVIVPTKNIIETTVHFAQNIVKYFGNNRCDISIIKDNINKYL